MSPQPSDHLIGQCLDERYVLESLVGYGGMSRIYKALDLRLHTTVAVKILNDNYAADTQVRKRFTAEAVIAANLRHPNVLKILDHNTSGQLVYLVMDYVRGMNLHELIASRGRLTPRQTLRLLEDICRGLAAAHAEQIVHRDMKPGNVLISHTGEVKITDFGLARIASEHTQSGNLLATFHYASPELLSGKPADARSDIYAVGVMIYQMLTGQVPFPDATPGTLVLRHMDADMPLPSARVPELAEDLDELVRFCTEKDPENRPQDASFLLDEVIQIRSTLSDEQLDLGSEALGGLADLIPADAPAPTSVHQRLGQFEASRQRSAEPWWAKDPAEAATRSAFSASEAATTAADPAEQAETLAVPGPEQPTSVLNQHSAATRVLDAGNTPDSGPPTVLAGHDAPATTSYAPATGPTGTAAAAPPTTAMPPANNRTTPVPEAQPAPPSALSKRELARAERRRRKQAQIPTHRLGPVRCGGQRMVRAMLLVLAVVLVAVAGWFFGKGPGSLFSIPQLTGLAQAQAMAQLDDAGVPVRVSTAYDDEVAAGQVIDSTPGEGSNIMRFQGVELLVSSGPQLFSMPALDGLEAEQAANVLAGLGLRTPRVSEQYSATLAKGLVISSAPATGEQLTRQSATSLVVSAGPAPVAVPLLIGMDEPAARQAVEQAGLELEVGEEVYSSQVAAGQVALQDPRFGKVAAGSSITVRFSRGPEYLPIPSVIGQDLETATATLEHAGFEVATRKVFGEHADTVRMQSPLSREAERGSLITLYLF